MRRLRQIALPVVGLLWASGASFGQLAISAKAGMINYLEGEAYLENQAVNLKFGQIPQVKDNQVLRTTAEGRAEVLLTPGSFLRIAESSSIRMLSDKLTDVRVEVLTGSALVEVVEMAKDDRVSLVYKTNEVLIEKAGIYRIDQDQELLRVFSGEAVVRTSKGPIEVKSGRELNLAGEFAVAKFDKEDTDPFYRWGSHRSEYIATANISAARSAQRSGNSLAGGWGWNPYYGMFAYIPIRGAIRSPYGWYYYSPNDAMNIYLPYYYSGPVSPGNSGGGGGFNTGYASAMRSGPSSGGGWGGGSTGSASGGSSYGYSGSPAASSSSAPAASASSGSTRGGGDSAGHGASGGGRGK